MIYNNELEDFESVNQDFKLVYFSSFSNEKSAVYTDMCNKMQDIENQYELKLFKFVNRI